MTAQITGGLREDSWAFERKHYRETLEYIELRLRRRETTRDSELADVSKRALMRWTPKDRESTAPVPIEALLDDDDRAVMAMEDGDHAC